VPDLRSLEPRPKKKRETVRNTEIETETETEAGESGGLEDLPRLRGGSEGASFWHTVCGGDVVVRVR